MDRRTADFYRTRAEEWAASHSARWAIAVDPFLDLLEPGARILDLGCGDGRDSERMIERGFVADPCDGVAEMAALASRRLDFEVPVMRFDQLAAENRFDAVWANAALLHVPLDELPRILVRIHSALKPGGLHYASYKGGEGGARDGFGRFYSYVSLADLEAAYRSQANGPNWRSPRGTDTASAVLQRYGTAFSPANRSIDRTEKRVSPQLFHGSSPKRLPNEPFT